MSTDTGQAAPQTSAEESLIRVLREHGPRIGNEELAELLPWRGHPASGPGWAVGLADTTRLNTYLRVALARARRAGYDVRAAGGDAAAGITATGWVELVDDYKAAELPAPDEAAQVHQALITAAALAAGPVTTHHLGVLTDAAWEELDTTPEEVAGHSSSRTRVLAYFTPAGSEPASGVADAVARVVQRVVAEYGLAVEYRVGNDEWRPVPPDSSGGYGLATGRYEYRALRGSGERS